MPENMAISTESSNKSRDLASGPPIQAHPLQTNLPGMGQHTGSSINLNWGGPGTESLVPSLQTSPVNVVFESSGQGGEDGLQRLRSLIQDQLKQICSLQTQLHGYHQCCVYYREKANTYKALYNQQQSLAEHTMASLVRLRQSQLQGTGGRR
jgi:hypothetical protein